MALGRISCCSNCFLVWQGSWHEDERLILQIFLMIVNKQDDQGKFGQMSHEDDDFEMARISEADLRVLLSCTLYYQDKTVMQGFCLYDRLGKGNKGK